MTVSFADYKKVGHETRAQHSKENALDPIEFERLFEGAQMVKSRYKWQAEFAVLACGRLGLRRSELGHMRSEWVSWPDQMLRIPRQDDCHFGKDGGICGVCRKFATQRAEYNEPVTVEQAEDWQWLSKTDAAARDVYFGYSPRCKLWFRRYFDEYESWEWSPGKVADRVTRAAENAEGIDGDSLTPHNLRATAATYHAGRGLETMALTQFMGWADPSVAEVYISRSGRNTARQLDAIHSA